MYIHTHIWHNKAKVMANISKVPYRTNGYICEMSANLRWAVTFDIIAQPVEWV